MKVNEIINEGPLWDKVKSVAKGVQGAVQGYQTSKGNRAATAPIADAVKRVTADWNAQKAQLAAGGVEPTAENFAQFMKPRVPSVAPATPADFANPAAYIQKAVAQHFANRANGITTHQAQPAAAAAGPATQQPAAIPGVKLIHSEPDIIEYKNVSYVVNDQGLWTPINSNKPVNQAMQAFLTKQADALTP